MTSWLERDTPTKKEFFTNLERTEAKVQPPPRDRYWEQPTTIYVPVMSPSKVAQAIISSFGVAALAASHEAKGDLHDKAKCLEILLSTQRRGIKISFLPRKDGDVLKREVEERSFGNLDILATSATLYADPGKIENMAVSADCLAQALEETERRDRVAKPKRELHGSREDSTILDATIEETIQEVRRRQNVPNSIINKVSVEVIDRTRRFTIDFYENTSGGTEQITGTMEDTGRPGIIKRLWEWRGSDTDTVYGIASIISNPHVYPNRQSEFDDIYFMSRDKARALMKGQPGIADPNPEHKTISQLVWAEPVRAAGPWKREDSRRAPRFTR